MTPLSPSSPRPQASRRWILRFRNIPAFYGFFRALPGNLLMSLAFGAGGHDVIARGPEAEIALLDGGGHQVGEEVGRAGERRNAHRGERRRVALVEAGRALVAERQQADHLRAACGDL